MIFPSDVRQTLGIIRSRTCTTVVPCVTVRWISGMTDCEHRIVETIKLVFANKGFAPPELSPETLLDSSLGLESIDFAELVVRLEREFGKDPFNSGNVPEIRSVGDLAKLYDH